MSDNNSAIASWYQAWIDRKGDLTEVPLAEDFIFESPLGTLQGRAELSALAGQFGPIAIDFRIKDQFLAEGKACSILQWELPGVDGTTTAAEILTVVDGQLTHAELLYDPNLVREFTTRSQ